jgi:cathepsin D
LNHELTTMTPPGSSNLWVGATTKFTKGTTGVSTGDSFQVSYGSGDVSGTEYTDTVSFGGATVSKQSIGVARTASGFTGVDGIIGFGPVDLTEGTVSGEDEIPTFMDNLYNQGTISTEVLGVYFAPESGSDSDDTNGELTLGGTDSSKYSGSITYTPTLTSGDFAVSCGQEVKVWA